MRQFKEFVRELAMRQCGADGHVTNEAGNGCCCGFLIISPDGVISLRPRTDPIAERFRQQAEQFADQQWSKLRMDQGHDIETTGK